MTAAAKHVLVAAAVVAACSRPAAGPSPAPSTADALRPLPSPVPEVVARVNGQAVHIHQILPLAKARLDRLSVAERDRRKPEMVRAALQEYVERELLLQEAMARGVEADSRRVQADYDQMRREHPDEAGWDAFLAWQGLDPQSLKVELRAQHTVAALLEQEVRAWPVPEEDARAVWAADPRAFGPRGAATPPPFAAVRPEVERAIRLRNKDEIRGALLARLRAKARIELFL